MSLSPLRQAKHAVSVPDMLPVIDTGRLTLRTHRLADADRIAESLGDFAVTRMLARVPTPYHRQDALDWLVPLVSGALPDWSFAIADTDDRHIGVVSVELRHGLWHLGYWLNRSHWGQGFMSEAVSSVLAHFFRHAPDDVVHSGVFADNPASLKIQEKLGFRVTGCNDIFSVARNRMVPHIETMLTADSFRPLAES